MDIFTAYFSNSVNYFLHIFCRAYCAQLERHFRKLKEVYVLKMSDYKNISFLTAIMGLEILNNIWKHFLQKIPVKSSFCREYCGQSKIHITKLEEVFVPKRPIYKKISHVLHRYYRTRDTCTSLQPILQTL